MHASDCDAPPRVLLVLNRFWPMIGGAERQCEALMQTLSGQVEWVAVYTHRYTIELPALAHFSGVPVYRIGRPASHIHPSPWTFYVSLCWALLWRRADYDLIHCHTAGVTGLITATMGQLLGRPVLLKLTASGELASQVKEARARGIRAAVLRFFLRSLRSQRTHLLALTPEGLAEVRAAGVKAAALVPNGVHAPGSAVTDPRGRKVGNWFVFGFAGRLTAEKGLNTVARAFDLLCQSGETRCVLQVVGTFDHQASSVQSQLESLSKKWPGRVILGGVVDRPWAFLASCHAYLSASTYEGLPNAVLEAIAAGLPCLLSDIDGHREIRRLNPDAWIDMFSPGDVEACRDAMKRLMSRPIHPVSVLASDLKMTSVAQRYLLLYRKVLRGEH